MRILRTVPLLAAVSLTGCVVPYVPPAGPAATLNMTMHNLFDTGRLDLVPTDNIPPREEVLLKNGKPGVDASISLGVPAGNVTLGYVEVAPSGICNIEAHFAVAAGQSYEVYVGDTLPPPPDPNESKILRLLFKRTETEGAKCGFTVRQIMPDGSKKPVDVYVQPTPAGI